jgi:hypothetical protein
MRKGIDGVAMLVQGVLRQDPFSGHLFLFPRSDGLWLRFGQTWAYRLANVMSALPSILLQKSLSRSAIRHESARLKPEKCQANPTDCYRQWYAGRDRDCKPDHLTAHGNRFCSASITVAGPPDGECQGDAKSCRSRSGSFGACALPGVFELWSRPSVFRVLLGRRLSREAASSALRTCSLGFLGLFG